MSDYKVLKGQNLIDISIQETGSISNVFLIAYASGKSVTDLIDVPDILTIPAGVATHKKNLSYFRNQGVKVATETDYSMAVENDALFNNGYLHPEHYLFPDSYLKPL